MAISTTNFSRETFIRVTAVRRQPCSCGCGTWIAKGQEVYARPQQQRGRGDNRIIDLEEHYQRWLEHTAHKYAMAAAANDRKFREYLGGAK